MLKNLLLDAFEQNKRINQKKGRHGKQDIGNPLQRKVKAFLKVKVKGKDFSDDSYTLGRQPVENEAA